MAHVFAAAVRAARKENGLSQLKLAELSGTSIDAVGAIEREVNVPTIETAAKLIDALGIDAGSVFKSEPQPRQISSARRDIEAEILDQLTQIDDGGAELALELVRSVAKAHPAGSNAEEPNE